MFLLHGPLPATLKTLCMLIRFQWSFLKFPNGCQMLSWQRKGSRCRYLFELGLAHLLRELLYEDSVSFDVGFELIYRCQVLVSSSFSQRDLKVCLSKSLRVFGVAAMVAEVWMEDEIEAVEYR